MGISNYKKIHFIGIGGIGVSALARLFLGEGKVVSGSDRSLSDITYDLEKSGVHVFEGHSEEHISDTLDLVVYTEAIREGTSGYAALTKARMLGVPTINYFDALGMVANEYYLIAVSGSHGKTTTTAMLIDIFEDAGLDPSAVVGSLRARTKSNYRAGKSKYFIAEACEYKRDFLSLTPDILIITNIEHEHVDYYQNLQDVQAAFRELALQVREGGFIIADMADEKVVEVFRGPASGLPEAGPRIVAQVIDYRTCLNPLRKLLVPGVHNQMNAAAALMAAKVVGIHETDAEKSLSEFTGTWRRFEYKGEVHGAKIYDDYGHHPTEIKATIMGARELYPDRKLTLVFQSHTYSRTQVLFGDFVDALSLPDRTFILPIYAAREDNENGISHTQLRDAVSKHNPEVWAMDTFDEVVETLKKSIGENDLVLVMGAGDITQVTQKLLS